jgi:hypothetical protein
VSPGTCIVSKHFWRHIVALKTLTSTISFSLISLNTIRGGMVNSVPLLFISFHIHSCIIRTISCQTIWYLFSYLDLNNWCNLDYCCHVSFLKHSNFSLYCCHVSVLCNLTHMCCNVSNVIWSLTMQGLRDAFWALKLHLLCLLYAILRLRGIKYLLEVL